MRGRPHSDILDASVRATEQLRIREIDGDGGVLAAALPPGRKRMRHATVSLLLTTVLLTSCGMGDSTDGTGQAADIPEADKNGDECEPGEKKCDGNDIARCNSAGNSWYFWRECKHGCQAGECLECAPDCSGRECGSDGCGGSCGECSDGLVCGEEHTCVDPSECKATCSSKGCKCGKVCGVDCGSCSAGWSCSDGCLCDCVPVCSGLECGDDGCGGDCGACEPGKVCSKGSCVGDCDGTCQSEGCTCGEVCGEDCGECKGGETCDGCHCICQPQCDGKQCGDDGCGGNCGSCAPEDKCVAGICQAQCDTYEVEGTVLKIVSLQFPHGAHPGSALDLDGDSDTCAPAGDCESGLNNSFGALLGQIEQFVDPDAEMAQVLADGDLVLLADFKNVKLNGQPFTMTMFGGVPVASKDVCDWQTEVCDYLLDTAYFYSGGCQPLMEFDNATIVGSQFKAGGPGYSLLLPPGLVGSLEDIFAGQLTCRDAQVAGNITLAQGKLAGLQNAVVGCAIEKAELLAMVDAMPDDVGLPVSKDMVKNLLDMFIANDIDTDGDGAFDSASWAIQHTAIAGQVVGVIE